MGGTGNPPKEWIVKVPATFFRIVIGLIRGGVQMLTKAADEMERIMEEQEEYNKLG